MCKICAKYAVFLAVMATVADFCSRPVSDVMQAQHVLNTWTSFPLWFSFVFMLIGILHVEYINKTVFKLSISIQMNPHLSLTTTFQLEFTSRNRNYICKRFIKSRPPTPWSQWLQIRSDEMYRESPQSRCSCLWYWHRTAPCCLYSSSIGLYFCQFSNKFIHYIRVASDTSFKEGYFFGAFSILPDTSFLLWS